MRIALALVTVAVVAIILVLMQEDDRSGRCTQYAVIGDKRSCVFREP